MIGSIDAAIIITIIYNSFIGLHTLKITVITAHKLVFNVCLLVVLVKISQLNSQLMHCLLKSYEWT
jgi:hypothetical protein